MFYQRLRYAFAAALSAILIVANAPIATATNYTVTYDSGSNQYQTGVTTGTTPNSNSVVAGSTYTASINSGNLARQGFIFNGWNTSLDGTGTQLVAGSGTVLVNNNITLYAQWSIPQSARLIGQTGTIVTTSNPNAVTNGSKCTSGMIRGITSDGTYIYYRTSADAAYICKITTTGIVVAAMNFGTNLSALPIDSMALVYASGCIFIRSSGAALTSLNCLSVDDLTMPQVALPAGKGIFAGQGWGTGNLISFPDGRIGAVSQPNQTMTTGTGPGQCPSTLYCKILRLYTLSGTAPTVTATFSEDIILADNSTNWPSDDHGIATDGTYLYQINFNSGYKVYALASGSPSYIVFNGVDGSGCASTSPAYCSINTPNSGLSLSNATYIGRNHNNNQYFIGDYSASKFWLSSSTAPPSGPGSLQPAALSSAAITGDVYKGITAIITMASNAAGTMNFYVDGKRIPNCQKISTLGSAPNITATCNWKPAVTAYHEIYAILTPTNLALATVRSPSTRFWVLKRTTRR